MTKNTKLCSVKVRLYYAGGATVEFDVWNKWDKWKVLVSAINYKSARLKNADIEGIKLINRRYFNTRQDQIADKPFAIDSCSSWQIQESKK